MISCFKHIKAPNVVKEIDVYDFTESIKSPDASTLDLIKKARKCYIEDKNQYEYIKSTLPCFTLNFNFNHIKNNQNIKSPTGLIYLDIDNETNVDLTNKYIFASWLSLSKNGRGVLVKAQNLNLDNFKDTYNAIAEELNIKVDVRAAKPTQYTVHSYDEQLYFNQNSITWICDIECAFNSTPSALLSEKKEKGNAELGESIKLRFNNYDEVEFSKRKYLYFEDEKLLMSSVIVPKSIKAGNRNSILSAIAYQIKALNPYATFNHIKAFIESVNMHHCIPFLKDKEVHSIITGIMNIKDIKPILNSPRRFLFNPEFNLTFKEKMKIVNSKNGQARSEKTINELKTYINNWDVTKLGKLTQVSLIKETGKNRKTVQKYYGLFKQEILSKNEAYKRLKLS